MSEPWNKEGEYDALIAPLMREILQVCKSHDIPMFATFQFSSADDAAEIGAGWCTSKIVPDQPGVERERLHNLDRVARHGWRAVPGAQITAITVTTVKP